MHNLAHRVAQIPASPTLALDTKAKALKAAGRDIINFGIGEPDFNTPANISEAAIRAIKDGFTRYTPVPGIMELREAISEKFRRDNGLHYKASQIVVSNGGKHSLYNTFLCLFQAGDEVILPTPGWVSYAPMLTLCGATPVPVETSVASGYTLTAEELERAITNKTRGIIINSPSNPTGMAYSAERLKELAAIILKHKLWVISDDIYEKITFNGFKFHNLPMVEPALYEQTVIAHGLSKTYAMTGWRMGFAAVPTEQMASGMTNIQSQTTANPCSITQKAALAALTGPQDSVAEMAASFQRRRDLILSLLKDIPNITCPTPQGAFYVFPDVSAYYGKKTAEGQSITNSDDLAAYLLETAETAIVPGSGFGAGNNLRLSYAVSDEDITRGLKRVKDALLALK